MTNIIYPYSTKGLIKSQLESELEWLPGVGIYEDNTTETRSESQEIKSTYADAVRKNLISRQVRKENERGLNEHRGRNAH